VPLTILGIETSCDETSASVVRGPLERPTIESLVILSQDVHAVFGGVIPEIASREHLTAVVPVTQRALEQAKVDASAIDAIAVTHAPGLVGALLVGVSYAKALGAALGKPVIGVHHMEGHLFATALEHPDATPPFTALLVSGGHTMLLDVDAWGSYRTLGVTRDDAAGEAFDKVAKLLGLPYPGGRPLEQLARSIESTTLRFTRPMLHGGQQPADRDYYDVSFSGLKTAALLAVREAESNGTLDAQRASIARAFQDALVDTLVAKSIRAARAHGRTRVVLGGGVACNGALVSAMRTAAQAELGAHAQVFAPTPRLATDNAAMIAAAGLFHFGRGHRDGPALNAHSTRPLPRAV
jgi:N6-L-threonylcarbamoyladenine synthase